MALPVHSRMTEDEYLAWELAHEGKHEFVNGELVGMAGVTEVHSIVTANIQGLLYAALRRGPCRVHGSDLRVRIDETGLYAYPDLTVVCGEPQFAPTRPESLLNPTLIVEVLSESTANWDRGGKLEHYRRRASVQLILLADTRRRSVTRYTRNPTGTWTITDFEGGVVSLSPIGAELSVDEIYEGADAAMARAAGA